MSKVKTGIARQKAIERVIKVMQAEFANEVAAVKAEIDANLPVPTPAAQDYYEGFVDPIDAIDNSGVAVYLTNESARTLQSKGSAGPGGIRETRTLQLGVTILFRVSMFEPGDLQRKDEDGNDVRPLTPDEVMRIRAECYVGAVDETVRKYGPDGENIHDVELTDDTAGVMPIEEDYGPFGLAMARFAIDQQTLAPRIQGLP